MSIYIVTEKKLELVEEEEEGEEGEEETEKDSKHDHEQKPKGNYEHKHDYAGKQAVDLSKSSESKLPPKPTKVHTKQGTLNAFFKKKEQ